MAYLASHPAASATIAMDAVDPVTKASATRADITTRPAAIDTTQEDRGNHGKPPPGSPPAPSGPPPDPEPGVPLMVKPIAPTGSGVRVGVAVGVGVGVGESVRESLGVGGVAAGVGVAVGESVRV